jgi:hypothetical protein
MIVNVRLTGGLPTVCGYPAAGALAGGGWSLTLEGTNCNNDTLAVMVHEQAINAAWRIKTAGTRTALAAVVGLIGGVIASAFVVWEAAVLLGWSIAAFAFLFWTWMSIRPLDAEDTKQHANIEDASRSLSEGIVIAAGVALLAAVGLLLIHAGQVHGGTKPRSTESQGRSGEFVIAAR